ncbi:uncharacterized protein LOC119426122 [Nematolebias whitei]|uniref:uncharacterized protein LOC119426122 n=1 Tax=Nematolebias whitei TaxID=451745 RepID=UPI00189836A9|nr:uncharacterized protein LOC119426122 [Nematolebias whitei]
MQHIIECARVGPCESKHYLCTLCGLPVANHMIINHIISFDHIYSYFKAWHPSTLQSKLSYRNYNLFVPTILNFAKLAEKIHETQHASMKQVRLQPDEFQLVNFTCYSEALEKLESITKSSLKTSVTPGHKIEYDAVFSPPKPFPKSHNLLLRCQNCCHDFESMPYLKHLSQPRHKKQLMKQFLKAVGENSRDSKVKLHLDLYTYSCEGLKTKPLVGVDLVVTCISSSVDVEPICLCFGCLERVPQPVIRKHCESRKHLIKTLMYQNPWRLPFAWKKALDDSMLKSEALEERGPNKISLKVVDIPHSIFYNLSSSINYVQAMKTLQLYHTLLKCEVPPCKTFSKLHQNEKFPLLGMGQDF